MSETITENNGATPAPEIQQAPSPAEPSQNPVKAELEKVKKPKTEAEKLAFSLKSTAKRAKELGIDPLTILGDDTPAADDEARPLTVADLKKFQADNASKNALSLADEIEDADERELVKHHIENTIKPSGNARQDLNIARSIVNSVKNTMIAEEAGRKSAARTTGTGSGAPAKIEEPFVPTPEESEMMKMKGLDGKPLLSKEDILKSRKRQ